MGVVHLALDPSGRAVAIKVLRPHIAHDPDARARLAREVQTLARVQRPAGGRRPRRRHRRRPALHRHPLRPRAAAGPGGRRHRPVARRRAAAAGPRALRRADRHPPGRRRPPGPQAGERAAAGRRSGRHRLRHRPRRRRHPADHDRPGHGYARVPLARGRRGCAGHDGHRLVGLGGDAGLRGVRAAAVRPRARWTSSSTGCAVVRPTSRGSTRGSPRSSPRRCRRTRPGVRTPTRSWRPSTAMPPVRPATVVPSRRQSPPTAVVARPDQDDGAVRRARPGPPAAAASPLRRRRRSRGPVPGPAPAVPVSPRPLSLPVDHDSWPAQAVPPVPAGARGRGAGREAARRRRPRPAGPPHRPARRARARCWPSPPPWWGWPPSGRSSPLAVFVLRAGSPGSPTGR